MDDRRVLILPPNRRDGEVTRGLIERARMTCCVCYSAADFAREIECGAGVLVLTDVALVAADIGKVLAVLARQPAWSDLPIVLLCPSEAQSPVAFRVSASLTNVTLLDRPASARTLVSAVQAALRGRLRQYETRQQLEALQTAEEALRAREAQLHTLAENTPDILTRFDRNLRHIFVNKAIWHATGLEPQHVIGHTHRELGLPPQLCTQLEEALRSVFATGRSRSLDFVFNGPEAERHYTNLFVPELGASGEVETVLGVAHDVTDSKNAEHALRAADRRKDEFLAMLAHELRNPLAPIRNAGELLARTLPADPRLQGAAAIVRRQIGQLARLVDDLLDVSRITQGRIELQRTPIDLSVVIAEALESVEPLMREKRHDVAFSVADAPLHVDGDSVRLVQCVGNLLANAAKYTDPGGEIRLEARADGPTAVVAVTDNGVGIPRELLPQIFELFVQSDRSLDRSQGGLGIGLSVVRRLIEMHGGDVIATSEGPGHGARFEVRLPLVNAAPAVEAKREPQLSPGRRVLIVDDNQDAANSLAEILNLSGHQAEPVFTSHEALERARSLDLDVILLDIGLPGMDGYEVARRIRSGGSSTRLVALTGYGQSEDVERAKSAGFDAHLVKPVDLQVLLRTLGCEVT